MNINGVSNYSKTTDTYKKPEADTTTKNTASSSDSSGVVYEASSEKKQDTASKIYKQDTALVERLKADAENRTAQLRSLVESMMKKQGQTIGNSDSMWKFLAGGNYQVDAATKAQAQKDISEDGYWGVEQTSERIYSFAYALTGGDPDKVEEMRNAFIKGYKQATGSWGKELPDISQKTYDAVMQKFDQWAQGDQKTEQ